MKTIIEMFDPNNSNHIKAWIHLSNKGEWPKGFIPKDKVEFPPNWQVALVFKLAQAHVDNFKAKSKPISFFSIVK